MARSEEGGVYIPAAVMADVTLNFAQKILFSAILHLSQNTPKGCFASDRYFAKLMRLSTRQIRRMLRYFEQLSLIERFTEEGDYSTRRFILARPENLWRYD